MNSTIYEATKSGPVYVLMGENQSHHVGRTVYRFERPKFPNGMVQTLPHCAAGVPCLWIDSEWKRTQDRGIIREWNTKITVLN